MKRQGVISKLRSKARELKQNLFILYLAYKDPRMPKYARWFTLCVVAYAFSPIDLIPDFIPIAGYLDDLVIVPLGITLALRMIPTEVIEDCRAEAEAMRGKGKPANWAAAAVFIAVWILFAVWLGSVLYRLF